MFEDIEDKVKKELRFMDRSAYQDMNKKQQKRIKEQIRAIKYCRKWILEHRECKNIAESLFEQKLDRLENLVERKKEFINAYKEEKGGNNA